MKTIGRQNVLAAALVAALIGALAAAGSETVK
jgi:hypothetical protein